MSILWRSICSEVRPYYSLLQSFPNFPILVISYRDTLTNVTQMKSHCQLVFVKKIRPRLLEQRPQNESATSVFRQTLAMVLILVVCLFLFSLFILCIDLANPAKCIQRKYRCTFVKFHRQTAPLGPGHTVRTGTESSFSNPPSPNSISASSPSSRPFYGLGEEVEDRVVSGWGAVGDDDDEMVDRKDVGGGGGGGGGGSGILAERYFSDLLAALAAPQQDKGRSISA